MTRLYNVSKRDFKRVQFMLYDLSKEAFEAYSGNTLDIFQSKENDRYYFIDCGTAEEIGTLEDVNAYFED